MISFCDNLGIVLSFSISLYTSQILCFTSNEQLFIIKLGLSKYCYEFIFNIWSGSCDTSIFISTLIPYLTFISRSASASSKVTASGPFYWYSVEESSEHILIFAKVLVSRMSPLYNVVFSKCSHATLLFVYIYLNTYIITNLKGFIFLHSNPSLKISFNRTEIQ